jgi:hypothetical protein
MKRYADFIVSRNLLLFFLKKFLSMKGEKPFFVTSYVKYKNIVTNHI